MPRIRLLILFILLAFAGNLEILAQQDPLPKVRLRFGQLIDPIPYGQPFMIVGQATEPFDKEEMDVIELRVYEESKKSLKRSKRYKRKKGVGYDMSQPFYTTAWVRDPENDDGQFELDMAKDLLFATNYRFIFNFYHRYRIDDDVTQRLVRRVIQRGNDFLGERSSIRVEDINRILNEEVIRLKRELKFGYLVTGQSGVSFDTTDKTLSIPLNDDGSPNRTGRALAELFRANRSRYETEALLSETKAKIEQLRNSQEMRQVLDVLDRSEEFADTNDYPGDYFEDLDALERFLDDFGGTRAAIQNLVGFFAGAQSSYLPNQTGDPDANKMLTDALTFFLEYQRNQTALARVQADIDRANDQIGTGLDVLIAEGFVLAKSADVVTSPFFEEGKEGPGGIPQDFGEAGSTSAATDLNTLRVGTVFGAGPVFLNLSFQNDDILAATEPTLITYVGAKFYLRPIDKRVKDRYRYPGNRISVLVAGVVSGDLSYRGQDVQAPVGFFPLAGLSIDLNRYLAIDIGGLFFQETGLTSLSSGKRLRVAPFLCLSADLNLVNGTLNLIKGSGQQLRTD